MRLDKYLTARLWMSQGVSILQHFQKIVPDNQSATQTMRKQPHIRPVVEDIWLV